MQTMSRRTQRSDSAIASRRSAQQEAGDSNAAASALRRLEQLFTDEVIPRLASSAEQVSGEPSRSASLRPLARSGTGRSIRVQPGVKIGPTGKLLLRILEHYPKKGQIYITSGYRPEEPTSHHGGLTYKGSPTAAIDIGAGGLNPVGSRRMRDIAKWLYDHFAASTVELIHTTPYSTDRGFYVKHQRKYPGGGPYGPGTRAEHRNHVHFATSKALAQRILARLAKPRSLQPAA